MERCEGGGIRVVGFGGVVGVEGVKVERVGVGDVGLCYGYGHGAKGQQYHSIPTPLHASTPTSPTLLTLLPIPSIHSTTSPIPFNFFD